MFYYGILVLVVGGGDNCLWIVWWGKDGDIGENWGRGYIGVDGVCKKGLLLVRNFCCCRWV